MEISLLFLFFVWLAFCEHFDQFSFNFASKDIRIVSFFKALFGLASVGSFYSEFSLQIIFDKLTIPRGSLESQHSFAVIISFCKFSAVLKAIIIVDFVSYCERI